MKIRTGFVSNSSSSSFVALIKLDDYSKLKSKISIAEEVALDLDNTLQVMKLIDLLEHLDDVQEVYSNLKITDEALEGLA